MLTPVVIETARFTLRALTEGDVSERYLAWFSDPASARYIAAAAATRALADLKHYIRERTGRSDILFLGIFDRTNGVHVGNLKYEPVDMAAGYAVVGILIGDPEYRGRGVAREVLAAANAWLHRERGIREIVLGVHKDNMAAIHAYAGSGFRIEATPHLPPAGDAALTMVWRSKTEC